MQAAGSVRADRIELQNRQPKGLDTMSRAGRWIVALALVAAIGMGAWFVGPEKLGEWRRDAMAKAGELAVAAGVKSPANRAGESAGASQRGAKGKAPVEVGVSRLIKTASELRSIGTLQSDEAVKVAPEISGRIAEISFTEGRAVKKGDTLVKLDSSLITAEVRDADARLKLAEANLDRARTLAKSGNATERSRDEAVSAFEIGKAALELAKARLDKHTVRAPFDGIAGVRSVSVGAYVTAGTSIVNLEKLDRMKLDFKLPQLYLERVAPGQKVEIEVDALAGRRYPGQVYAIDPLVDVDGRAIRLRARLDNSNGELRPGLFARVVLKGLTEREVVVVPESAIVPRGGETFVFKVESGKAVERRVRLGERRSPEVEILEGLEGDATIVIAGQQQLKNGAAVEIAPNAGEQRLPAGAAEVPPAEGRG